MSRRQYAGRTTAASSTRPDSRLPGSQVRHGSLEDSDSPSTPLLDLELRCEEHWGAVVLLAGLADVSELRTERGGATDAIACANWQLSLPAVRPTTEIVVPLVRNGTWDHAIWTTIHHDYPALPASFAPDEILLDVGCHTGAVCELGARRGATVVGYEANRENYTLAALNLAEHPSVRLHLAAVWRSDLSGPSQLVFSPHADTANTGGGSVLYGSPEEYWSARPSEGHDPAPPDMVLSSHPVDTVGLDHVLSRLGPVRVLKLDVEGAEFPILLTASRLDLVDTIVGEYHEFSEAQMNALAPAARVGHELYNADLLRRQLEGAGYDVTIRPGRDPLGYFTAERRNSW
jgi:FkbM family methyltransferase